MYYLLKAELIYHKIDLLIMVSFGLIGILANVITGWQNVDIDIPGVRSLMAAGTMVACFFRLIRYAQEKKDRYQAGLPLPLRQVGISRLLYITSIWGSLVILFWISTSTIRPYLVDKIILETLTLSGFILMANAILFIYRDFLQSAVDRHKTARLKIFNFVMIFLGYVLFYFLFVVSIPYFKFLRPINAFKENFNHIASSPLAVLLFNLGGIFLTIISVGVFERRQSYLS